MANQQWAMDAAHTEVQFKVKHLMISTVTGTFHKFDAKVETDGEDFSTAKVHFTADVNSISTNNPQRDEHLKSADFFDAANNPQIVFEGNGMQKESDDVYKLHGNISMRGVTKPITLEVEFGGITKDPWGNTRAGVTIHGKLNRKDFGVHWNAATEAGGLVVGEEVKLNANAEFIKVQVPQTA
jgi:polyisoprenoid-binding protein YceI